MTGEGVADYLVVVVFVAFVVGSFVGVGRFCEVGAADDAESAGGGGFDRILESVAVEVPELVE